MNPKLPPHFIVGETYVDRDGDYTVISIVGDRLIFERANGVRSEGDAILKARIHQNILSERGIRDSRNSLQNRRVSFSGNRPVGFTHAEVFPVIAETIDSYSNASQGYFKHDSIVSALIDHPELRPILDQLAEYDPQEKSISWWASNMVDFFSKVFTDGRSKWEGRFERERIDEKWAYRVRRGR
jgi:hypothetical protein